MDSPYRLTAALGSALPPPSQAASPPAWPTPLAAPPPDGPGPGPFAAAPDAGAALAGLAGSFAETLRAAETAAAAAMTGGADPQSVVMALARSELAVETAVTLRDRVVEAYQEILRMPV
jgi:flagellar hook-basal body complex protein FliE